MHRHFSQLLLLPEAAAAERLDFAVSAAWLQRPKARISQIAGRRTRVANRRSRLAAGCWKLTAERRSQSANRSTKAPQHQSIRAPKLNPCQKKGF